MLMEKTTKKSGTTNTKKMVGEYIDHHPTPTCLRNHAFVQETNGWQWTNSIWLQKKLFKIRI